MGARIIRKRDASIRKKQETLTLWTIMVALAFPMLLAAALVAMDMRSDLSELKSTGQPDDKGAVSVGWPELARQNEGTGRIRMIGYMMDGYQPSRDGAAVDMFVLLPEAGQFLHPAHRIPNQMVEVHLSHPVVFHYRDLVWATGILNRTMSNHGDDKAAYAMIASGTKCARLPAQALSDVGGLAFADTMNFRLSASVSSRRRLLNVLILRTWPMFTSALR